MRSLITILLSSLFFITSCSTFFPGVKFRPEYQGVDPRVQGLVDEYIWLSKQNHIAFGKTVTVGFKKINRGNVIGVCTYGDDFREIDLDIDFWENTEPFERMALAYHELTHCYCTRDHDWAEGKEYPETEAKRIAEALEWRKKGGERPGRFEDGCPTSLMYPVIVEKDCVMSHYQHYVDEMFERCDPYGN